MQDLIISIIEEIIKEYYYLDLDKDYLMSLVSKSIDKLPTPKKDKLTSNKQSLKKYLKKLIIKDILKNEDTIFKLINNYIFEFTTNESEYINALKNLIKLSKYFTDINYTPTPDLIIKLLEENSVLNFNTKVVVDRILPLIKEGKHTIAIDDTTIIQIIETYCMLNNIEIKEYTNEDLLTDTENSKNDSLRMYVEEVTSYPLLTDKEVKVLAERIESGDETAKDELIKSNLRLVISTAKRYVRNSSLSILDHIQNGNLGLIKAVEKYDHTKGFKFSTYAIWWINRYIIINIDNQGRTVRIPSYKVREINRFTKAKEQAENELGRMLSIEELSQRLKISKDRVEEFIRLSTDVNTLNIPVTENGEELVEFITDPKVHVEEESILNVLPDEVQKLFKQAKLSEREIDILMLNLGFYEITPTFDEIGEKYSITGERARQIKAQAIKKLRFLEGIESFSIYTDNPDKAISFIEAFRIIYKKHLNHRVLYNQNGLNRVIEKKQLSLEEERKNQKCRRRKKTQASTNIA